MIEHIDIPKIPEVKPLIEHIDIPKIIDNIFDNVTKNKIDTLKQAKPFPVPIVQKKNTEVLPLSLSNNSKDKIPIDNSINTNNKITAINNNISQIKTKLQPKKRIINKIKESDINPINKNNILNNQMAVKTTFIKPMIPISNNILNKNQKIHYNQHLMDLPISDKINTPILETVKLEPIKSDIFTNKPNILRSNPLIPLSLLDSETSYNHNNATINIDKQLIPNDFNNTLIDLTTGFEPINQKPIYDEILSLDYLNNSIDPLLNSNPIVEPIVKPIAETLVEPITETLVEQIIEPIVEPFVKPIIEPIVKPIVEPIIEPIVEVIVEPIVEQLIDLNFEELITKSFKEQEIEINIENLSTQPISSILTIPDNETNKKKT